MTSKACAISHALNRLSAMQTAAMRLFARDQLGRDFFKRGEPTPLPQTKRIVRVGEDVTLPDLPKAYARIDARTSKQGKSLCK